MNRPTMKITGAIFILMIISQSALANVATGCSPGYWKQEIRLIGWENYHPGSSFVSAGFKDVFPGLSLKEVLYQQGDGLNALGRHAVAALLTAASDDLIYPYDASEVIALFNTYQDFLADDLKDAFVELNEMSCSLK